MINDDEKSVSVKLPSGKELLLSDEADEIALTDDHQNSILMNGDGITLESGKDIILKTSAGDLKMDAINLKASMQAEAKVEGSATAELSSSGATTVKGGIVQIN
jgi:hypothetical protein